MTHETRKLNGMLQRLCLLVFAAVCISGLNLPAQTTTGSLVGTAFDPSGAVIAKCTIKATNVDTNSVRQVQTNEAGYYNIPSLAPGTYKLEATAPGFSTITSQVVVKLGAAGTFDIHLTPGAVTQSIQVDASANSVELDTSSHQVDAQLPSQSIENLPTSGRDVFETLQSLPNVAPFQNAVGPVNNFRTASNSLTIGGSASGTTSYLQDGVTNIAMLTKTANFQPSIEATQEVSIIQNGASAQYDELT